MLSLQTVKRGGSLLLAAALLAALAVFSNGASPIAAQTPTPSSGSLMLGVGLQNDGAMGQAFTPGDVTIATGGSVTWQINSDEPHTITFGTSPDGGPSPFWPVSGWTAPPPGPPSPVDLGSVQYDGSQFLNTGILVRGSTASVQFSQPGDYPFICSIHPGMTGVIHVVDSGETTTQAEADQMADDTTNFLVSDQRVEDLRQQALDAQTSEVQADGTTTWTVAAGEKTDAETLPGGGTGYLDLMEFNPDPLDISAGDTVVWTSAGAHTVTFLATGQTALDLELQYGGDPTNVPAINDSSVYDGESTYSSGLLGLGVYGAPDAPDTYSLTFPNEGSFDYVCLLHEELGMEATINVGPSSLPNTGQGPAPAGSPLGWPFWLAVWLTGGAVALAGIGAGIRRFNN